MPKPTTFPKVCSKCKVLRAESEYKIKPALHNTSGTTHSSLCIECQKTYDVTKATRRRERDRKSYNEKSLNSQKLRSFGITIDEYRDRLYAQKLTCAICLRVSSKLHLDHCHRTGRLREFLCMQCNILLGVCGDNVDTLERAVQYLKRHTS